MPSRSVSTPRAREGGCPQRAWKLCCCPSPHRAPCVSSTWPFLSYSLYNNPVIVSKVLSLVLWAPLASYRAGEIHGDAQFVAGSSEVQVTAWNLWLPAAVGGGCLRVLSLSLTCGACADPRQSVSELSCRTSRWCLGSWRILEVKTHTFAARRVWVKKNGFFFLIGS